MKYYRDSAMVKLCSQKWCGRTGINNFKAKENANNTIELDGRKVSGNKIHNKKVKTNGDI